MADMSAFPPAPARLIAIVPAAGIGARAQLPAAHETVPKQYRLLGGIPVLCRAVQALLTEPRIAEVRVVVAADDTRAADVLAGLPRTQCRPCGGPTRADTVLTAVRDAHAARPFSAHDWLLVHDAARPGLPPATLARLIDACLADGTGGGVGGLLALPLADTLKQAVNGKVARTVPRDDLWLAQTPQMFRADLLRAALEAAHSQGISVTDEASAMEAAGHAPILVQGDARNVKLTWPEDFDVLQGSLS